MMKQESYINIKEMRYLECHRLYKNSAEFQSHNLSLSYFAFEDMEESVHM